jgi:hypothetical protein
VLREQPRPEGERTPTTARAGFTGSPFGVVRLDAIGVGWLVAGLYALLRARIARTA